MAEERIGLWLQQTENARCYFWHRYSVTVDQAMEATVKLSKWWLGGRNECIKIGIKHSSITGY